jgi:hypothetical protein
MRCLFFVVRLGLAISCLAMSPCSADGATIEGRVVDSAGKPIARAEVRIWQKPRGPDGRLVDRPVEFDGSEVLVTDAEGRFVSPDVLVAGVGAQVVAEASGMLAGRSGLISIAKDAVAIKLPDITLKGLRLITGRVVDRRGQPVDGVTVFNSGDGHERIETRSKGGGRFLLTDIPRGGVFLFAEKPCYRFAGVRLPADQAEATLVLTSLDEPAEPKASLPPLLSPDEEYALARSVLDPWLERLAQFGTPEQKFRGFSCWTQINGPEAFRSLDWLGDVERPLRDRLRYSAILSVIAHHDGNRVPWDEVRGMIEAGDDEFHKAAELIQATDEMDESEQATRLKWVESAVPHARKVGDPEQRVRALASAAERLFGLGEVARARQILAEAENEAKPLLPGAEFAFLHLALAVAHDDADRAIEWLAKTGIYLSWHGGRVAAGLLPVDPRRAVEAWKLVAEARHKDRGRTGLEYRAAAEFCYRLAKVDRALAEQVAADADETVIRYREQGAIILALAETQPAEARRLLATLVREELSQLPTEAFRFLPLESAPAIAAWLLPVAERVDPDLCGELFWRSLALRLPRPRRDLLSDQVERTDIQLAMLLARYDRDIARALLEDPGHPLTAGWLGSSRFVAALHIDPRWAKNWLDTPADAPSSNRFDDSSRSNLLYTLALPQPERWSAPNDLRFWEPSARDKPLPP